MTKEQMEISSNVNRTIDVESNINDGVLDLSSEINTTLPIESKLNRTLNLTSIIEFVEG